MSKYTPPPHASINADVTIIGDSDTGGSRMRGPGSLAWPGLVTSQLRKQGISIHPWVGTEDGSGYTTPSSERGLTFAGQIDRVIHRRAQLVVLFGSTNDMKAPAPELATAVQHTLATAKVMAPSAKLLVIGPVWVSAAPPPELLALRDVVKAGAEAAGATFVDPIAERWLTDRPDLMDIDRMTPNEAGHAYLADKIAPLIAQQLQPSPEGAVPTHP